MNIIFPIIATIIVVIAMALIVARVREQRKIKAIAGDIQASHRRFSETLDEVESFVFDNRNSPSPASELPKTSDEVASPAMSVKRLDGKLMPAHCSWHSTRSAPSAKFYFYYRKHGGYTSKSDDMLRGYNVHAADEFYYEDESSLVG